MKSASDWAEQPTGNAGSPMAESLREVWIVAPQPGAGHNGVG